MNRGHVLPVQQMVAAGNPNSWWNMINTMRQPPQQYQQHQQASSSSPFLPPQYPSNFFPQYSAPAPTSSSHLPFHFFYDNQELHHESLTHLLASGLVGEDLDHKGGMNHFHEADKKMDNNWEEQVMHHQASNSVVDDHVKQENNMFGQHASHEDDQFQQQVAAVANKATWSPAMLVCNSPNSCVTNANSSIMTFSSKNDGRHPPPDRSSESNSSTSSGGALKKARVQAASTTQSSSTTFKVRKEKLGDRITALHQLVSPFGKTDTASVLLEAIGYIRFLQNQIEALSLPYLGSGSGNNNIRQQQQQSVQGERNCIFPEDPGQLLNDNCLKRKGASHDLQSAHEEAKKDLRSKGLCLVPVSCTLQVGSDNGADYWAPAGFR